MLTKLGSYYPLLLYLFYEAWYDNFIIHIKMFENQILKNI